MRPSSPPQHPVPRDRHVARLTGFAPPQSDGRAGWGQRLHLPGWTWRHLHDGRTPCGDDAVLGGGGVEVEGAAQHHWQLEGCVEFFDLFQQMDGLVESLVRFRFVLDQVGVGWMRQVRGAQDTRGKTNGEAGLGVGWWWWGCGKVGVGGVKDRL